jgi:hypothetical protein
MATTSLAIGHHDGGVLQCAGGPVGRSAHDERASNQQRARFSRVQPNSAKLTHSICQSAVSGIVRITLYRTSENCGSNTRGDFTLRQRSLQSTPHLVIGMISYRFSPPASGLGNFGKVLFSPERLPLNRRAGPQNQIRWPSNRLDPLRQA